jgi:hypothetical protein
VANLRTVATAKYSQLRAVFPTVARNQRQWCPGTLLVAPGTLGSTAPLPSKKNRERNGWAFPVEPYTWTGGLQTLPFSDRTESERMLVMVGWTSYSLFTGELVATEPSKSEETNPSSVMRDPEPDNQNPVPVCSRAGPNSVRTAEAVMQDTLLQVLALR